MPSDEKGNNLSVTGIGLAVDIVKSVPIEDNAKKVAGNELGKTAVTLTKAINFVLLPISATVYGYEKIKDFVENRVSEKLKGIAPENILPPKGNIVGPALENLKYLDESEGDNYLKEMYANIIANSINSNMNHLAHPAFVEIIKQLNYIDVLLIEIIRQQNGIGFFEIRNEVSSDSGDYFLVHQYICHDDVHKCADFNIDALAASIDNLDRLKIVTTSTDLYFTDEIEYDSIQKCNVYKEVKEKLGKNFKTAKGTINFTVLGRHFVNVCSE